MKNIATAIILTITSSLLHAAALEMPEQPNDVINIGITQKENETIINYQLNDHTFSFNAKILSESNTIKNLLEDCKAPLYEQTTFLTKQLFDGLNHKQVKLLIKALKRNHADTHAERPLKTAHFVNMIKKDQLCWITDQAHFWDIGYVYNAAVKRIAACITYGKNISLHTLNDDIGYDIKQNIDCANLKIKLGSILQQTINPYHHKMNRPLAIFNAQGTQLLFAETWVQNIPPYLYDIQTKHLQKIDLPSHKEVIDVKYTHDDTHIIVKIAQHDESTYLLVYNSKDGTPIQKIPLESYYENYSTHKHYVLVRAYDHVAIYTNDTVEHIYPPEQMPVRDTWYTPDGTHICIITEELPLSMLYIYDAQSKQLCKTIRYDNHVGAIYSRDAAHLALTTADKVLLYDTHNLDNPPIEIVHLQDIHIKKLLFSPDNMQLLILTLGKIVWLYNIADDLLKQINMPYRIDDYNNYITQFSTNSSQLLMGTTDHWMLEFRKNDGIFICNVKEKQPQLQHIIHSYPKMTSFTYYKPDCSYILCTTTQKDLFAYNTKKGSLFRLPNLAENFSSHSYNADKTHMAIATEEHFIIRPTLTDIDLSALQHIQLLSKAYKARNNPASYAITTHEEKEVYDSLNPLFQDERLFKIMLKKDEPAS